MKRTLTVLVATFAVGCNAQEDAAETSVEQPKTVTTKLNDGDAQSTTTVPIE